MIIKEIKEIFQNDHLDTVRTQIGSIEHKNLNRYTTNASVK